MKPKVHASNPGPSWGFRTIGFFERILPEWVFRKLLHLGTCVGWLFMKEQRRHSRAYLLQVTGREPGIALRLRHFTAFMDALAQKLQAQRGILPEFTFSEEAHSQEFEDLCRSDTPALFGTFHVGYSDMMGCMLRDFDRPVSMVRLRVGNSMDTEVMGKAFQGYVRFLWINEPDEFIFKLKESIQAGASIGLQCDRVDFGGKTEAFEFLGARRLFPTTIYHLAYLFDLPVVFAFTGPSLPGRPIDVHTSPVFYPSKGKRKDFGGAKAHFQDVLKKLECHLQNHPELWFNFLPLNRAVDHESD